MLVDVATIKVQAGNGGRGIVSFLREKGNARGGPNGGNGGNGGSVYLVADHNLATLIDFRSKAVYKAENGAPGQGKDMTGIDGEDIRIKVPTGTLVYELDNEEATLIGDLVEDGQELLVAKGGVGGRGNASFKSSTNQAPRQYTPGTPGEAKELKLEIKLIADIGLIGMPNAGKSTLLNHLTAAKAKVGSYPFTTLSPNLGVCRFVNGKEAVIADIPGLIEGASAGKGLGDEFLRHVERTRLLVHVVDPIPVEEDVPFAQLALHNYEVIRKELEDYSAALIDKPEVVVVNKLDITEVAEQFEDIKGSFAKKGLEVYGISAFTGRGVEELKLKLMDMLDKLPPAKPFRTAKVVKKIDIKDLPNRRMVFRIPSVEDRPIKGR